MYLRKERREGCHGKPGTTLKVNNSSDGTNFGRGNCCLGSSDKGSL